MIKLTIFLSEGIPLKDNQSRQRLFQFGSQNTVGYVIHSIIRQFHLPHSVSNSLDEYGLALQDELTGSSSSSSSGYSTPTPFTSTRTNPLIDHTEWLDPLQVLACSVSDVCSP